MKKLKLFGFLITFLILPFFIFSQKDYQKGYIVSNEGDTIEGSVKDRKQGSFGKLYKKIYFKKVRKKKKYGPNQITAYKMGDSRFESLWIQNNNYPFQGIYSGMANYGDKSFLKLIEKGDLSYYHWEFEDSDSGYIDYIGFFKRKDKDSFVRVTQGIFGLKKKSLANYFQDCPELVSKIENGELNDPIKIVKFYNLLKEHY